MESGVPLLWLLLVVVVLVAEAEDCSWEGDEIGGELEATEEVEAESRLEGGGKEDEEDVAVRGGGWEEDL